MPPLTSGTSPPAPRRCAARRFTRTASPATRTRLHARLATLTGCGGRRTAYQRNGTAASSSGNPTAHVPRPRRIGLCGASPEPQRAGAQDYPLSYRPRQPPAPP